MIEVRLAAPLAGKLMVRRKNENKGLVRALFIGDRQALFHTP
jgi:hypothetical protein